MLDNKGKPELRLFVQSSSCKFPYGLPPKKVLDEKSIDVAFLGVASAQNVKAYPQEILKQLSPKKIVLIHWEDFFMNLYRKKIQMSVRATNMRKFMRHLKQEYNCQKTEDLTKWFSMPLPLKELIINY